MDEAGFTTLLKRSLGSSESGGAGGRSRRRIQRHGGANERLQRLFINLVALIEIDIRQRWSPQIGVRQSKARQQTYSEAVTTVDVQERAATPRFKVA